MTGKISEDDDRAITGTEKFGAAFGGQNWGITPPSIANWLATFTQTLSNKTLESPVVNTPTGITRADVGLSDVDNTSDAAKNAAEVTLQNKTISAAQNVISSLGTSNFAAGVVDTDGTLAANSDTRIATQKAVRTAINALIGANDVEVFKGAIDCSANPNYPAADAGHVYRVSVAGKIGGASGVNVEIGDRVQCIVDSSAAGNQATVGANWWITQTNIDGAVVGPASATDSGPAVFDGTTGKLLKSIAYSVFKSALSLVKGDVGLGNVDNTSDTTKWAAAKTLTNTTFNTKGTGNGFTLNGAAFGTAAEATAALNAMVGDSGSGGAKGLVPAPGAGDAAAQKYLKADGTYDNPPGTGGGGSLSDTDRRNILLDRIYQSKLFVGYRRGLSVFADGFKASDGINTGASTGYNINTTTGSVLPSISLGSLISGATGTSIGDMTSGGGLAAGFDGTTSQSFAACANKGSSSGPAYLGKNYSSSPQRIYQAKTYGSSDTGYIGGSLSVTMNLRAKNGIPPANSADGALLGSVGPVADTDTTNSQTITSNNPYSLWDYVWVEMTWSGTAAAGFAEVEFYPTTVANMTVVTTAQTASATVGNGRVLLEIDNSQAPLLNADLTVEVSCNGGANWTAASLSSVSANGQAGRSIIETVDQACTSGTSFAARIKTANNKLVPIYGVSLTVH